MWKQERERKSLMFKPLAPAGIFSGVHQEVHRSDVHACKRACKGGRRVGGPVGGAHGRRRSFQKICKKSNEKFTIFKKFQENFAIFSIFLNFIEFLAKIWTKI